MDKYEYKVRADEIKELISRGEYAQAAEIADTIDWRRVKSVMMLCTISDLYKINRRYEDARDMLLLAYERRPGGRTICYSLCELSIKMEEFVEAVEYYKEFVQAAPKDPGRFILQYKLYEAQDVSLEERIAVLEELKKRDYREKWAYELAYLYHRMGLAARCVEECDELILWFGDGKYVIKAMELKMLHQSLSPSQQEKYNHRFDAPVGYQQVQEPEGYVESDMAEAQHENIATVPSNMGTDAVAMEDNMVGQGVGASWEQSGGEVSYEEAMQAYQANGVVNDTEQAASESEEELDIHVKTMDMGQYNTINLQAELAAGLREVLAEEQVKNPIEDPITRAIVAPMFEMDTETLDYPEIDEVSEDDLEPVEEEIEATEVFFGETGEIGDIPPVPKTVPDITAEIVMEQLRQENIVAEAGQQPENAGDMEAEVAGESAGVVTEQALEGVSAYASEPIAAEGVPVYGAESVVAEGVPPYVAETAVTEQNQEKITRIMHTEPPRELANVLSQESDGQLSLVMPESEQLEKQITGQMNIEDILAEWERMKKENQEKREEEVRRHVLQQTGNMFTEFEAAVRDGLLEQLEREKDAKAAEENAALAEEVSQEGEYFEKTPKEGEKLEEASEEGGFFEEASELDDFFEEAVIEQDGELGEVEELEEIVEEVVFDDETEFAGEGEVPYAGFVSEEELAGGEEVPCEGFVGEEELAGEGEVPYAGFVSEEELAGEGEAPYEEFAGEEEFADGEEAPCEGFVGEEKLAGEGEAPYEEFVGEEELAGEGEAPYEEFAGEEELAGEGEAPYEEFAGEEELAGKGEVPKKTSDIQKFNAASEEQYIEPEITFEEKTQPENTLPLEQSVSMDEAAIAEELKAMVEKLPVTEVAERRAIDPEYEETMEELRAAASGFEEAMVELQASEAAAHEASAKDETAGSKAENIVPEKIEAAQQPRQTFRSASQQPKQAPTVERDKAKVRALTREEKELYAPFIQSRAAREQLVRAIDNITLAAYTGNVIITGEEGMDTLTLAKNMIRELQATDSNFSGKVAKISGHALNGKDVATTISQLKNGALIISKVSELNNDTAGALYKALQQENQGIVVVLVDAKKPMDKFLAKNERLKDLFTARMDVEALSNDTLVAFGRRYARELEYSIDELGMLALHTRIAERQTIDHVVTVIEVKEIVDKAIRRANKKTLGHFFDILFAKRYDEEDMIVLSEKDFA